MDVFWNDMPIGRRNREIRSQTLPRSFGVTGQPRSRRSLTAFPRYGIAPIRERTLDDYRPMTFHEDVFPSFTNNNDDDFGRRININREDSDFNNARAFPSSRLSSDIDDMFRNHTPVLTIPQPSRDIPVMHSMHGGHNVDGGHVINIVRDGGDTNEGYRRYMDSDNFGNTGSYRPSRNVRFADDDSDSESGRRPDSHHENRQSVPENDTPTPASEENKDADLVVKGLDCHVTDNARAHHTELFQQIEKCQLIVRRGQKFEITLELNRPFDIRKDQLFITFTTGNQPQPGKGNTVTLRIPDRQLSSVWFAEILNNNGVQLRLALKTDTTCIVGEWKMAVRAVHDEKKEDDKDRHLMLYGKTVAETPLFILFNPWNRDDRTFFADTDKLSEYVLNDSGCMFTGTDTQIEATPWFYGQFELGVLEAVLYCVRRAFNFRSGPGMGDPVKVARAITRIVNSNDENGLLVGNWSGNYTDGRSPQLWVGSGSILRKYHSCKRPVKYGQCYVFAGVVTTICRALGLPCRTVTNFSSAHDSDGSVTVDVHWDLAEHRKLPELDTDSMWNFHVWNDVWMARKDLPFGNDGWQVIDATPQETSGGKFSCGPAPLAAILNGRCDVSFDTPFIFAEVNADRVHWGRHKNGTWNIIGVDKTATGKKICTKTPDGRPVPASLTHCDSFREDITDQYKHREDSSRERMSVMLANALSPRAKKDLYSKEQGLEVEIKCPDHVLVGSDVVITIACKNKTGEQGTLKGKLLVDVVTYTGKVVKTCKEEDIVIKMGIYDRHTYTVHIKADQYLRHVSEVAMMKVSLLARVNETDQVLAKEEHFKLRTPDLKLKCFNSSCQVGRPLTVQGSFKNPLQDRPLTNCYLYVECSGMEDPKLITIRNVPPYREMTCDVEIAVTQRGRRQIFATFFCNEINDVKGILDIYVQ